MTRVESLEDALRSAKIRAEAAWRVGDYEAMEWAAAEARQIEAQIADELGIPRKQEAA